MNLSYLALFTTLRLFALLNIAPAQPTLSWSSKDPSTPVHGAEETWVMPTGAVQATQQRLPAPPREWYGYSYPKQHRALVAAHGVEVNFMVEDGSWCLLTDQSIACLNKVMQAEAHDLGGPSLDDAEKLHDYLNTLDGLILNPRIILDDKFVRSELDPVGRVFWLNGREKRLSALLQLCYPLAITRRGTEATITYHELLMDGSVVRRTVHAQTGDHQLMLIRLEAVQVRPPGTFSFDPPLGG